MEHPSRSIAHFSDSGARPDRFLHYLKLPGCDRSRHSVAGSQRKPGSLELRITAPISHKVFVTGTHCPVSPGGPFAAGKSPHAVIESRRIKRWNKCFCILDEDDLQTTDRCIVGSLRDGRVFLPQKLGFASSIQARNPQSMSINTLRNRPAAFAASLLSLCVLSGCRSVPTSPYIEMLGQHQACCLNNVHVIFVESPVDVLDIAGVKTVAASMNRAGCGNVEILNFYHGGTAEHLAERIRQVQSESPASRILVASFSSGTLIIEEALRQLEQEGRRVDTTIYIDSEILTDFGARPRPANSDRYVLVYRENARVPQDIPGAELYLVDEFFHLSVPTNQTCLDAISLEIGHLASGPCPCACHNQTDQLPELPAPKAALE